MHHVCNCKTDSAGVIVSFHISASRSDPGEEEILARIKLNEVTYPKEVLLTDDPELLCSCLCKYVMETRKENGERYPPKTILNLSGLLRYMRENKKDAFNIMDDKDPVFLQLHKVLDSFFRLSHSDGIGTKTLS